MTTQSTATSLAQSRSEQFEKNCVLEALRGSAVKAALAVAATVAAQEFTGSVHPAGTEIRTPQSACKVSSVGVWAGQVLQMQ